MTVTYELVITLQILMIMITKNMVASNQPSHKPFVLHPVYH